MIVNNKTGEITTTDKIKDMDEIIHKNYSAGVDPYNKEEIEDYGGPEWHEPLVQYSDKTNRIEQAIKALGTMVLHPQEISDPNNIGQKVYGQPIQRPILEGVNRDKVLNKLVELIIE